MAAKDVIKMIKKSAMNALMGSYCTSNHVLEPVQMDGEKLSVAKNAYLKVNILLFTSHY